MNGIWVALCALTAVAGAAAADTAPAPRESLDEAWWTGPLLAPSPGTLPPGHVLFEPYVYDSIPQAHVDGHGASHGVTRQNDFGSQSYLIYGLADRFSVGLIPRFGFDRLSGGASSSGLGFGDLTIQAQYRLNQPKPGGWIPTLALNLGETLPTGRFDRLDRASDGFGAGAYATSAALYSQSYIWMPNGRILRARLDLTYSVADPVRIDGMSVYGTAAGFRGRAGASNSFLSDLAFEYSATRNWVLAMDLAYEQDGNTRVWGAYPEPAGGSGLIPFADETGLGRSIYLAPALEYNWNSRVGVIFGARVSAFARNETASVTPVAAVNYVY